MVNLTRIYTKSGDDGETHLANNAPVQKSDPRLEAFGAVDEANCAVGIALAGGAPDDIAPVLAALQNQLFDLGADLATPGADGVDADAISQLEAWCDQFNARLPVARSFVIPGGSLCAAHLFAACAAVRRAERAAWVAADEVGLSSDGVIAGQGGLNPLALRYLNRLSDLLFILARHANKAAEQPEVLWVPAHSTL